MNGYGLGIGLALHSQPHGVVPGCKAGSLAAAPLLGLRGRRSGRIAGVHRRGCGCAAEPAKATACADVEGDAM